jgi:WD40 repeat protein
MQRFEHPGEVRQVRFLSRNDNAPIAISTCRDNILRFWDVTLGKLHKEVPLAINEEPSFLVVSSEGQFLAIGSVDQKIHVWNLETMTEFASISTNCKDLCTNSSYFVSGSRFLVCPHGGLTLWNVQEDTESIAFPELTDVSRGRKFAISPDGNQLAVCMHGTIHFIDGRPK